MKGRFLAFMMIVMALVIIGWLLIGGTGNRAAERSWFSRSESAPSTNPGVVPEPATLALVALGTAVVGGALLIRKRNGEDS